MSFLASVSASVSPRVRRVRSRFCAYDTYSTTRSGNARRECACVAARPKRPLRRRDGQVRPGRDLRDDQQRLRDKQRLRWHQKTVAPQGKRQGKLGWNGSRGPRWSVPCLQSFRIQSSASGPKSSAPRFCPQVLPFTARSSEDSESASGSVSQALVPQGWDGRRVVRAFTPGCWRASRDRLCKRSCCPKPVRFLAEAVACVGWRAPVTRTGLSPPTVLRLAPFDHQYVVRSPS